MDKLEKDILSLISDDAKLTPRRMAQMLGEDEKSVAEAVTRLEKSGIIVGYTAIINTDEVDDDSVEALIEVKVTPQGGHGFDAIAEEIAAHPEVQNLYLMSGAYDLAVIVRGNSLRNVSSFVSEKISRYDAVLSTATHFILKKYKVEGTLMHRGGANNRISIQP